MKGQTRCNMEGGRFNRKEREQEERSWNSNGKLQGPDMFLMSAQNKELQK